MSSKLPQRFPYWRLWWRAYYSTETTLARLPVLLLLPTVAALVGSAWAASHPAYDVRYGLVAHQASFGATLVTALVSGLVGLLALVSLVFAASFAWYKLRGDSTWEADMEFLYQERSNRITSGSSAKLVCKVEPLAEVSSLGHVEAVLRSPSGSFTRFSKSGMGVSPTGLGFAPIGGGQAERGTYEMRWYATRQGRRLQEIVRVRARFDGERSTRV
jgi:hypothetical protein